MKENVRKIKFLNLFFNLKGIVHSKINIPQVVPDAYEFLSSVVFENIHKN